MHSRTLALFAAASTATLFALPGNATSVNYCGPNLCFEYDDAQAAVSLYGQPQFAGDDAYFLPTVFRAQSADGVALHSPFGNTDFVDGTFVFSRIYTVNPNNEISGILAYEEGDYEVNYAGGEVHGDLYLRAFGLNAVEPTVIGTDSVDFYGNSGGNQIWSMSATIYPSASLIQAANNLTLTIQNQLSAFTSDSTAGSEYAYIEKKLILEINTLIPINEVVPVPAAVWLFGSGLGVLGWFRRRST
ncbi:MAG: VPLPA-CTERM sorting domain-containing protein [Gammaproteobacteria bacterium]